MLTPAKLVSFIIGGALLALGLWILILGTNPLGGTVPWWALIASSIWFILPPLVIQLRRRREKPERKFWRNNTTKHRNRAYHFSMINRIYSFGFWIFFVLSLWSYSSLSGILRTVLVVGLATITVIFLAISVLFAIRNVIDKNTHDVK